MEVTKQVSLTQQRPLDLQTSPLRASGLGVGAVSGPKGGDSELNTQRNKFGVSCFQSHFLGPFPENLSAEASGECRVM